MGRYVEIMDTTLRDGEQVYGVSYTSDEKFTLGRFLLEKLKVDRIEVASALGPSSDLEAVKRLSALARERLKKPFCVEVLCFLNKKSIEWVEKSGAMTINLLAKGSLLHLKRQLRQAEEEHFSKIEEVALDAKSRDWRVNIYLEDVSFGIQESEDYVRGLLNLAEKLELERIMLPDTRGILSPSMVEELFGPLVKDYRKLTFDFHGHNDYGLATANSLVAVEAGFNGIHATINGMGERAGNTPLEEVVVALKDFERVRLSVDEKQLQSASFLVQRLSGKRVAWNKPIVGDNIFTHVAGIHADGEKKGNLYTSKLNPERFGREKVYSLGKLSGKASIEMILKSMGIELSKEGLSEVVKKVREIGEKKKTITEVDLLYIASEHLKKPIAKVFEVEDVVVVSEKKMLSAAMGIVKIKGREYKVMGKGDGGFDAFMNSISKVCRENGIFIPRLVDYEVSIPRGGKTDAIVETKITWVDKKGRTIRTIGVSPDQVLSSIQAAEKAINFTNSL